MQAAAPVGVAPNGGHGVTKREDRIAATLAEAARVAATAEAPPRRSEGRRLRFRIAAGLAIGLALVAAYWSMASTGALDTVLDGEALRAWIADLGPWGPFMIIVLLAAAIVLSPIPSAPIALAAGAAYGHEWGTVYVVIGAELGALIAFGIARLVGHEVLRRWFGPKIDMGLLGSQTALMAVVFVSRLLPFVSFDLISYAAGLTALKAWRFALATLAGIIPASFLLAHFGGEMASAEGRRIAFAIAALGGLTLVPLAIGAVLRRRRLAARAAGDGSEADEPEA